MDNEGLPIFFALRLLGLAPPAQEPVVELSLRAARRLNSLQCLRFLDERLGLPPFDALAEKLAAPRIHGQLCFRDSLRQSRGDAFTSASLLDPRNPVCDLAGDGAGRNQPAAAALTPPAPGERVLQPPEFRTRGFHRRPALVFLNFENLKQAPHGARNCHVLDLRCQRGEAVQTIGEANALAGCLHEKTANGIARAQGAVEIRVRARLVSADAHQILGAGINCQ